MAFIPGENLFPPQFPDQANTVVNVEPVIPGGGVSVQRDLSGIEDLALDLIAGANISITPAPDSTGKIISRIAPGVVGIIPQIGSGITSTISPPPDTATLDDNLIQGQSITFTKSTVNSNLTINNNRTLTSANGSGITLTGSVPSYNASLSINPVGFDYDPGVGKLRVLSNEGALSLTGVGFQLDNSTGNIVVENALNSTPPSLLSGCGLSETLQPTTREISLNLVGNGFAIVPGVGTAKNINNSGVLGLTAGSGISINNTTSPEGNITSTVNNTGILGINVSGSLVKGGTANEVVLSTTQPTPILYKSISNPPPVIPPPTFGPNQSYTIEIFVNSQELNLMKNGDPNNPNSVLMFDLTMTKIRITNIPTFPATGNLSLSITNTSVNNKSFPVPSSPIYITSAIIGSAFSYCSIGQIPININNWIQTYPNWTSGSFQLVIQNNTTYNANLSYDGWGTQNGRTAVYYYPNGIS